MGPGASTPQNAASPLQEDGIAMLVIYAIILLVAILVVYLFHAVSSPEKF
jgi:hypothetical protein